ncbi:MAG TPA: AzlC family ABC transporter permease [Alphaproteobacteria bacterium]|jgi:4-azaleucine resistance transporter AzlC|nr:AzlC family ABC transporter permease [Alphaproteobacteria bacterium]
MTGNASLIQASQLTARAQLLAGAGQALPVVAGVAIFGTVWGALAVQAGLSPLEVALMSGLVFSGAAQFVAIELWSSPVAVGTIAFASLLVGLRHVLMGASIEPVLRSVRPRHAYLALFFMVDEAWAMSLRRAGQGKFGIQFYIGLCGLLYLSWLTTTVAGALLGGLVADPARYGFDVVFTAVFVVLIVGLWQGKRDIAPWAASAVAAIACHRWVPGNWYIFAGGAAGLLTAVLLWSPLPPQSTESAGSDAG